MVVNKDDLIMEKDENGTQQFLQEEHQDAAFSYQ